LYTARGTGSYDFGVLSGIKQGCSAVWNWTGRVDDYRGRLGVILGIPSLLVGGVFLLLRAFDRVDFVFAVIGLTAVVAGVFLLAVYISAVRAASLPRSETARDRLGKLYAEGRILVARVRDGSLIDVREIDEWTASVRAEVSDSLGDADAALLGSATGFHSRRS
jgi:hypothetical protein